MQDFEKERAKDIAKRMAERMKKGETEQQIFRYLNYYCSWSKEDTEQIIKWAKEIMKK